METVPGYAHAPAPRPMRAHTFNFNCTYEAACILDGECKASTTNVAIAFMVLHSTEQLVTQDMAMSMLTTSHQMTVKMRGSGHLKTTMCRTHTYELGHVKDLKVDAYEGEPHIQKLPKCFFRCLLNDNCESIMVESDPHILELWKGFRSEPKLFIHTVMHAVDILAEHCSTLNLAEVKRMHNKAFNKEWKEPEYRMKTVHDLQTKREIQNPDRFLYCKATMDPELAGDFENKLHEDFEEQYRKAIEEQGILEECKKYFENTINSHKRHKTNK